MKTEYSVLKIQIRPTFGRWKENNPNSDNKCAYNTNNNDNNMAVTCACNEFYVQVVEGVHRIDHFLPKNC